MNLRQLKDECDRLHRKRRKTERKLLKVNLKIHDAETAYHAAKNLLETEVDDYDEVRINRS